MSCVFGMTKRKRRLIPGSVADSSGYHIPPKPGSDFGPWNCSRWETFELLALYPMEKLIGACNLYIRTRLLSMSHCFGTLKIVLSKRRVYGVDVVSSVV